MKTSMRGPGFAGPVLSVLLTASTAAPAMPGEPGRVPDALAGLEGTVPKLESASAQLAHAASLRSALRGKDGEAKDAARRAAIDAYRAVKQYFAGETHACAEAAFRAGELLRSADDVAGALAEFQSALERGADTPFKVRAGLEIAHLHRRAKDSAKALAAYEAVIADPGATPGQRDDASYWTGQVYASEKRVDDARRAWQRVADKGEDPLDRVRAWDCIATTYVDAGDLEAAAGTLEKCRESLSEASAEETRLGERVRNALAAMRAVGDLQRAVEKRDRAKASDKKVDGGNGREGGEKKN